MKVLVTGGAGFIGSVVTETLIDRGHDVVVYDSLIYGHRAAVHPDARFVQGNLLDSHALQTLLAAEGFDAVVHLAAEAYIDDSLRDPGRFYRVNVTGGINLLDAMVETGIRKLVFSSTAAVYGQPEEASITEEAPLDPCNSYGDSKLAFEHILAWYRPAHHIDYVCLRYFNACGATRRCGEFRKRETHLIPICFDVALAHRPVLHLYGTDYDTPDGTCIRDYIHVEDIAAAHLLALENLARVGARAYNLGNGEGYSNRQVIEAVSRITGRPIPVVDSPRRPGDPARLVASSARIREELGWKPRHPELINMVETVWNWRQRHPQGYAQS